MNRTRARTIARKMRRDGATLDTIAKSLAAKGYKSQATGKPLTVGGVSALMHVPKRKTVGGKGTGTVKGKAIVGGVPVGFEPVVTAISKLDHTSKISLATFILSL